MEIQLTQNKKTTIDSEDLPIITVHNWTAHQQCSKFYAIASHCGNMIYMHRFLLNTPKGLHTDHVNGNTLDNRRCNLRIATCSQNIMNQALHTNSTSGYKGVTFYAGKWRAKIMVDRYTVDLGRFFTIEEAALAYNRAALQYHGKFAYLNKVPDGTKES